MNKDERSKYIYTKLEELFPETPVPLDHKDPYTLLIAVLLSAQCTDIRVNKTTPALFKKADSPKEHTQRGTAVCYEMLFSRTKILHLISETSSIYPYIQ